MFMLAIGTPEIAYLLPSVEVMTSMHINSSHQNVLL